MSKENKCPKCGRDVGTVNPNCEWCYGWRERFDKQFGWRLGSKTAGRIDYNAYEQLVSFCAAEIEIAVGKGYCQCEVEVDAAYEKGKHEAGSCSTTEYQDAIAAAEEREKAKHEYCSGMGVEEAFKRGRAQALQEAVEAVPEEKIGCICGMVVDGNCLGQCEGGWNSCRAAALLALSKLSVENNQTPK